MTPGTWLLSDRVTGFLLLALLGLAVLFGLIVLRLIPIEEALLESAYADAYRSLRSRTWCLVPWIY